MNEIQKIPNTKEVKFANNRTYVLCQDGIRILDSGLSLSGNYFCIQTWGNYLLTQSYDEKNLIVLDEDLEVVKEISGASNYALWLFNSCGLIPVEDKVHKLSDTLNLEETPIVVFSKDCKNDFGLRRGKNCILCDHLTSNQLNWRFELGDGVKVIGEFILFESLVVVTTNNQELIGIELNSGEELWRLKNVNVGFFQVQPETNYLISLNANSFGDNWYVAIDPTDGKLLIDQKLSNFYYDASGNKACITGTHYYFISNVKGDGSGTKNERTTHLGCINLQTHELEWIEKVGTTDSRRSEYQKPEVDGNIIYLLDGEETLHIYELSTIK